MNKCRNHCGAWNPTDAKYCRFCGIHMPTLPAFDKNFRIGLYLFICIFLGVMGFGGVALKGDGEILHIFQGVDFSKGSPQRGILWFWCAILVFYRVLKKLWDKWDQKKGNHFALKIANKESQQLIRKLEGVEKTMDKSLAGGSLQGDNKAKVEASLEKVKSLIDKLGALRLAIKMWETDNKVVGYSRETDAKRWPVSRKIEFLESYEREADSWKRSKDFLSKVENQLGLGPQVREFPDQVKKTVEDFKAQVALNQADPSSEIKPAEPTGIDKIDLSSIFKNLSTEALAFLPNEKKKTA